MEFMEGDTPQSMFAMWWKEICDRDLTSTCPPEKTCAGTTGEPILDELRTNYFSDSDYTFDSAGCYYKSADYPAKDFYDLESTGYYKPNKMMRIRRLWQFPSYSPVNPLPTDVYNRET
jgi:hypothetical protein